MNTGGDPSSARGLTEVAATPGVSADSPPRDAKPCILLVEDSATTLKLVSRTLSERYALLCARNGVEAWELMQAHPEIELVVTDIVMPQLSGHELLTRIRESDNPQIRSLPVVVIAGLADKEDRHLAFRNGANDFVTKPIDATELQARVHVHHKLARTIRELETSRQALAEQATTDSLTQLKNRRAFYEQGRHSVALSQRSGTQLSLILLDVDHFKRVNDTHGHQAGDKVLVAIAELLGHMGRAVDTVARVGGEEFAILLPDTAESGAQVLAERIRAAVEQNSFPAGDDVASLTVSIGVANFVNDQADSIDALLQVADRRLYLAKKAGRNRVVASDSEATSTR